MCALNGAVLFSENEKLLSLGQENMGSLSLELCHAESTIVTTLQPPAPPQVSFCACKQTKLGQAGIPVMS